MIPARRLAIFITLAATLLVAACGQNLPNAPDDSDGTEDGYEDDYGLASPAPDTDYSPDPIETSPTPSPTSSAPSWGGPPNDYRRKIGKGFLSNLLHAPKGLATAGNLLFISDGNRTSPRGSYGAVMVFDGTSEDTFTTHAGMYYERWLGESTTLMLASNVQAVAVNEQVVLASDAEGVKGFIRANPLNVLNGGRTIAPSCRDMAFAGGILYMAQTGQIVALSADTWSSAPSLNVAVRGLGADAQGKLWVVTTNRIMAYKDAQKMMDFDARGTDGTGPGATQLQDVAVDPRNGDVYALDETRVLRFSSAGNYLGTFGAGRIEQGTSIAVGADGSVYVSDAQDGEVYQYRPGS